MRMILKVPISPWTWPLSGWDNFQRTTRLSIASSAQISAYCWNRCSLWNMRNFWRSKPNRIERGRRNSKSSKQQLLDYKNRMERRTQLVSWDRCLVRRRGHLCQHQQMPAAKAILENSRITAAAAAPWRTSPCRQARASACAISDHARKKGWEWTKDQQTTTPSWSPQDSAFSPNCLQSTPWTSCLLNRSSTPKTSIAQPWLIVRKIWFMDSKRQRRQASWSSMRKHFDKKT